MLHLFRGIDAEGKSIVFFDGDMPSDMAKAAEGFSGNPVGSPAVGSSAHCIGDITGVQFESVTDPMEKMVQELAKPGTDDIGDLVNELNKKLAKRGLKLLKGTAEQTLLKALDDDDSDIEERTVMSVVLEPNDGENDAPLEPDTQGDIYSANAIEKTAHGWMEKGGEVGLMHEFDISSSVAVLETYIAPVDFEINGNAVRKGSWLLKLRILSDKLWEMIKDETLGAFSVGGTKISEPVEN